ncbi:lysyl oxidase family protein [Nocardioides dongkuii]|uniref:lysyl oxidase family protein n=1 Tax=Nocardioides dongkuii TaxID=2760089 RepID=UPI0015FE57AA|nr:lysyl oxidase family protein [Nocardioides dongkuii]
MPRRPLRSLLAATALGGLALTTLAVLPAGAGAPSAPTTRAAAAAPVSLWAPPRQTVHGYRGKVWTDLGLRLVAEGEPFEVWATRSAYDQPVRAVWRSESRGDVVLPRGAMRRLGSLKGFVSLTFKRKGADPVRMSAHACFGGTTERVRPDAAATSSYPRTCAYNPYSLGAVQGVQDGWASTILGYDRPLRLGAGRYTMVARIAAPYARPMGLSRAEATRRTRLVVKDEAGPEGRRPASPAPRVSGPGARPAAAPPSGPAAAPPDGPVPDLRSLPAWGIGMARSGNFLRFSATVWNAGDSPLVVDGFRKEGEDEMEAYQYFFDAEGEQTGYQEVGHMHWDKKPSHQHWHFKDFATYTLLRADKTQVVRSRKEAFCLANTDAVDLTVPAADWDVENDDLETACGDYSSLSIREVLAAGWGDTYEQFRAGQSFDLRGLPNGKYWIAVVANPRNRLVESDTGNNVALRKIRLRGKPGARRVVVPKIGVIKEPGRRGR